MSEENPWKTLGSKHIYTNPWISVREDDVIRPDGKPGIYGVIETRIATGVVALTPENEIYLVGQYRYTTKCYSWEIPEGGTEDGEEALDCAKRELKEETGLMAASWTPLGGEIHVSNCISSERAFLYLAQDLEQYEATPEGTEVLQLKKVPFAEAVQMALTGKIYDALSVAGILLADRTLRS